MIVLIAGVAQSGKDTIADYLVMKGLVAEKYNFALPLKKLVNALFGWGEDEAYGTLKETDMYVKCDHNNSSEFRELCYDYGLTNIKNYAEIISRTLKVLNLNLVKDPVSRAYHGYMSPRKAYQLFGTEVARELLGEDVWIDMAPTNDIVIPDMRFPNEYAFARLNEAIIMRVTRDEAVSVSKHASEDYISLFPIAPELDLKNNGSLEDLYKQVDQVFGM